MTLLFRQNRGHAVNLPLIYPHILFSQFTPQQINGDSQQKKAPHFLLMGGKIEVIIHSSRKHILQVLLWYPSPLKHPFYYFRLSQTE